MRVLLGTRTLAFDPSPKWDYRMSFALFCPHCGDVWARVLKGPTFYALQRNCLRHSTEYSPGGSFFQDFDWGGDFRTLLLSHPELAKWEFQVHMAWAERFINAGKPAFQQELEI